MTRTKAKTKVVNESSVNTKETAFWFKDPKDMTSKEKWALPLGPIVICERKYTFAEHVAGVSKGLSVCWPILLETKFKIFDDKETLWDLEDKLGNKYKLRQFVNGAWFREQIYIQLGE